MFTVKRGYYSFLLLLFFFGCKQKQPVQVIEYPVPDGLKNVALFQKNSYWVYRNDSTGIVDSTYVNSDLVNGKFTHHDNEYRITLFDYIQMPLQSSIFKSFYLVGRLGNFSYPLDSPGYPFYVDMGLGYACGFTNTTFVLYNDTATHHHGDDFWDCYDYTVPRNDNGTGPLGGDQYTEFGDVQNLNINNLIFKNVRKTLSYGFNEINDSIDFYFSPHNGLVKVVLRVDTALFGVPQKWATKSWSLLRYHVVQ
jgi:hypothetical protein